MAQLGKISLQAMLKTVFLTSVVLTVPLVIGRFCGWFEKAELAAYDDFMQRRPAEKLDDRIVIVTVSDDDIEQLQQYPLHDATFAAVLEKLTSYQPRAIGLDVARDIPYGPPAGRKQLAQIIAKNETIISGCFLSSEKNPGVPPAPGASEAQVASTEFPKDIDKTVRQVSLVATPEKFGKPIRTKHLCNHAAVENEIPALSLQLASIYLEYSGIKIEPNAKGEIQADKQVLHRLYSNFGSYVNADTRAYQMMLNYRDAKQSFRDVSISDVLNNKITPQSMRGRIVLIGNTSDVSKDLLPTPYVETQNQSRDMYGVMVHAHAVSQILSAVLDQRPLIQSWSEIGEVLWIWVWSLGSGLLAFYNRRLGFFLLALGGTTIALWGICYGLFLYQGLWIPLIPTLTVTILTALGVRLIDLANRTGYAQAIYEQVREQLQGNTAGRDRQGDYLAHLVQRAQAARQGHDAAALLSLGAKPTTFDTPQMQALYEQVVDKVREDLATEQSSQQRSMPQMRGDGNKASRMQSLLHRAQQSRIQPSRTQHGVNQTNGAKGSIPTMEKPHD